MLDVHKPRHRPQQTLYLHNTVKIKLACPELCRAHQPGKITAVGGDEIKFIDRSGGIQGKIKEN